VVQKKFRGEATKDGEGWKIEFSEEFKKELEDMSPEDRAELEKVIEGLKNGTIDPTSMGKRMCNYCGNEVGNQPVGTDICKECQDELR
jgi:hypothetical protein